MSIYRLGLCNMFLQSWKPAYDQYMNAEKIYNQYKQEENVLGRLAQIKRMAAACWTNYEATLPKDSLSKITDNTTNKDNKTTQLKKHIDNYQLIDFYDVITIYNAR